MGSFEETFKGVLKRYVREFWDDGVEEITSYRQETYQRGGSCDTCRHTSIVVEIFYVRTDGEPRDYAYNGSMAELINSLIGLDNEEQ